MSGNNTALTVQDAARMQASQLRLVHRRLAAVPDICRLTNLTCLDLSENPLQQLEPLCLPVSLKELLLAGCKLSGAVPASLTRLTAL